MANQTKKISETTVAHSVFVDFMTLFGNAQQLLKNRMHDERQEKLGPLHMRVLSLCLNIPGCTQQQVVQNMGRDKGQVARLARDLEEHGLIERTQDERDRRVWRLALTPEGMERNRWFAAVEIELAMDMFGGLDAQQREGAGALLKELALRINRLAEER